MSAKTIRAFQDAAKAARTPEQRAWLTVQAQRETALHDRRNNVRDDRPNVVAFVDALNRLCEEHGLYPQTYGHDGQLTVAVADPDRHFVIDLDDGTVEILYELKPE